MKKLSLLPIVLFIMLIAAMVNPFGCREKKNDGRYFYVGYNVVSESQRAVGSFTFNSDSLPSLEYFKDIILGLWGCYGYTKEEIYILSLHEFKDSLEYKSWVKPNGGSVFDSCVNIKPKSISDYKWEMISGSNDLRIGTIQGTDTIGVYDWLSGKYEDSVYKVTKSGKLKAVKNKP